MRATRFALPALIVAASSLTGCTRVLMQGVHEVRGAKSRLILLTETGDRDLARFQSVRIEPLMSTLGPVLCPRSLHDKFNARAAEVSADLGEHYPGGRPTLTVHTEVQFFQEKGILSAALMVSRVVMKEGDAVVADSVVLAESKSYRAGGESAMTAATLKAIRKFLEKQKDINDEEE